MRKGYVSRKFTDVCDVMYGFAFDSKCFTENPNDMPLIRIRDIQRGYSETFYNGSIPKEYIINEGEFLVGMDGEFNIGAWGKRPGLLNQRVCRIKSADDSILVDGYMFYFMKVCLKEIEDETPFVTVKHLSAKRINQIIIPLPPKSTQLAIVLELDKINELIRLKKEQLVEYNNLAQSIFYEMFGDPVENEKGWEVKKLGEISNIFAGGDKPTDIISHKEGAYQYPVIANGEGEKGILGYSKNYRVKDMAVTIGARGASIGNCRIVNTFFTPAIRLITIIPNNEIICQYLFFFVKGIDYNINGAGQAQLTVPNIKDESIPIPPLPLQQSFASRIEQIEKLKSEVQNAITDLETLLASRMQYWFE